MSLLDIKNLTYIYGIDTPFEKKALDDVNLSKYKDEIVVKCNHNSGGHLFYDRSNPPSEKELAFSKIPLSVLSSKAS